MIYRFMGLDAFLDILLRKELTFVSPEAWDDPYEVRFLKEAIGSELTRRTVNGVDRYRDFNKFRPLLELQYAMESTRAQCWTAVPESDAFWRIYYNAGKTLRIAMKRASVEQLEGVFSVDVNYVDDLKLTANDVLLEDHFYELFCTKRSAFEHEKEVRLLVCGTAGEHTNDLIYGMFLDLYQHNYLERHDYCVDEETEKPLLEPLLYNGKIMTMDDYRFEMYPYRTPEVVRVPIDVSHLIESVMVSPFAPDWYVDMIEMLCSQYGIECIGKSRLYQLL